MLSVALCPGAPYARAHRRVNIATPKGHMGRTNNFDFLRQFAAFLVILGHSQTLRGDPVSRFWDASVATTGVHIFFSLSGYLVTESWLRDPNAGRFLLKRSLRIFPGLALCVLLTALVLGPLLTTLPLSDYFAAPATLAYLTNMVLHTTYELPGLFAANPYQAAVNGSLWTLPIEFVCYVGVLIVALIARHRRVVAGLILALALVLVLDAWLPGHQPLVRWDTTISETRSIMGYFLAGAMLRLLKDHVPLRADLAVVALACIIAAGILFPGRTWIAGGIAVPYLVLCFGLGDLAVIRRFGRFGDPSYGMYLYAFPIQQSLIYGSANRISLPALIVATTALSVTLGYASWHLVEHRSLLWSRKRAQT